MCVTNAVVPRSLKSWASWLDKSFPIADGALTTRKAIVGSGSSEALSYFPDALRDLTQALLIGFRVAVRCFRVTGRHTSTTNLLHSIFIPSLEELKLLTSGRRCHDKATDHTIEQANRMIW